MHKETLDMMLYYHFPKNMNSSLWKKNMFFTGVRNSTFFKYTKGGFPISNANNPMMTHPIFVLDIASNGPVVCPGSRKNWNNKEDRRYILAGTVTSTNHRIRDTTYLVEEHRFCVPRGVACVETFKKDFTNIYDNICIPLYCMGVIKENDIKR